MNSMNIRVIGLIAVSVIGLAGCDKFIEVDPPVNQLISRTVFEDDETAKAALSGLYAKMITSTGFASGDIGSVTFLASLSSDDLEYIDIEPMYRQFYGNSLISTNGQVTGLWADGYNFIYLANSIIAGLENSNKVSVELKEQLIGEAIFLRAFFHMYLFNLFGDIPYVLSVDYLENANVHRQGMDVVYTHLEQDLLVAESLLSRDYKYSSHEKTRPNSFAASALLARVYLFWGKWEKAEEYSTKVINNIELYGILDDLSLVFLKNSYEAIWQLSPVNKMYTNEGNLFLVNGESGLSALSDDLVSAYDADDKRLTSWFKEVIVSDVPRVFPYKYKDFVSSSVETNEYSMVMRLTEQFLIRAEARVFLDKIQGGSGAVSDINVIRGRAGLLPFDDSSNEKQVLDELYLQRRLEFFTEWGHRWIDLKRTDKIDSVLSVKKSGWVTTDKLYPIPNSEVLSNRNIVQNDGY